MIRLQPMRGYAAFNPNLDSAVQNRVGVPDLNAYKLKPPPGLVDIANEANQTPDALDSQSVASDVAAAGVGTDADDPSGFQESEVDEGTSMVPAFLPAAGADEGGTVVSPPAASPPSWWSRNWKWVAGVGGALAVTGTVIAVALARRKKGA